MAYDFKKEYKDLYLPKVKPSLIEAPAMNFVAVAGTGDPNQNGGFYQQALELLYSFSYTIKMSKMGSWQPEGYFDFVVPPLEGFWWISGEPFNGTGIQDKTALSWISLIRQPDFVTAESFEHACSLMVEKKPNLAHFISDGKLQFLRFSEGLCAQVMHRGSYDSEPATIEKLEEFIKDQGFSLDIGKIENASPQEILEALNRGEDAPPFRFHHEIYLSDPRRTKPENLKTVIRHSIV